MAMGGFLVVSPPPSFAEATPEPKSPSGDLTHSVADHYYTLSARPDWVVEVEPDLSQPLPFQGPINPGVYFRLVDYQTHVEKGQAYHRYLTEFLSVAGVHGESEFEIEFDPAYQELTLHTIRRYRDGEWSEILDPDSVRITVPEDELGEGLLDGHVSVLVYLEDIRPGDLVDYDYTLTGRNPVFEGFFVDTFATEWETTVQQLQYRLLKSPERKLQWKTHGEALALEKNPASADSPWEEWIWKREHIAPRILENRLPSWFLRFGKVEISEFPDWQSVAEWGARQYEFRDQEIDPEIRDVVDEITRQHSSPEARAIAAIRFVQDSIRYLGIEDGANAFRPVQPNQSFRRRFGDCKDKTVLLGRLLAEMDIESDPVCVHHAWRERITDLLPSPIAFDHVVTRIRLPGDRFLWCDATSSHQGGTAETLAFPRYGRGLVIHPSSTDLIELPEPDPSDHRMEIIETFFLGEPGKSGEPARLEIETIYTGSEADTARYHLESSEPDSLRQVYLDYYLENYPSIESDGPIEPTDDREANRLVIREKYRLPDFWQPDESDPGWYYQTVTFQGIRDLLSQPDHLRRTMPYAISHPDFCRHEIRLHLPGTDDDWAGYFDESPFHIESAGAEFKRWQTYDPEEVYATIVATYESRADAIAPEELEQFNDSINDIYELTTLDLWEVNEEEEAAAGSSGESVGEQAIDDYLTEDADGSEEKTLRTIGIGIGILVLCVLAAGFGSLLTFFLMRSRRPAPAIARAPSAQGTAEPPPLPPHRGP